MIRTRIKRSVVWTMPDDKFSELVKTSVSVGDICRKLSTRKGGQIFTNIQRRIHMMKLDTNHFIDGRVGEYSPLHISKEEFMQRFTNEIPMDAKWMKKKIIEFSMLPHKCNKCGLKDTWNNEPLTLHMDHVDGDYMNNSLSNLRFLCPNCHSQTPTFSMGKRKKKEYICQICKVETSGYSDLCPKCASLKRESKRKNGRETR